MNKLIIALIAMVAMIIGTGIYLNLPANDGGTAKMGTSFASSITTIIGAANVLEGPSYGRYR